MATVQQDRQALKRTILTTWHFRDLELWSEYGLADARAGLPPQRDVPTPVRQVYETGYQTGLEVDRR